MQCGNREESKFVWKRHKFLVGVYLKLEQSPTAPIDLRGIAFTEAECVSLKQGMGAAANRARQGEHGHRREARHARAVHTALDWGRATPDGPSSPRETPAL